MAPCDAKERIRQLEDLNFELSMAWREAMIDAKRYRRLRVLGAAPSTWQASVPGTVCKAVGRHELIANPKYDAARGGK